MCVKCQKKECSGCDGSHPNKPSSQQEIKAVPIVDKLDTTDYILCIKSGVLSKIKVSDLKKYIK